MKVKIRKALKNFRDFILCCKKTTAEIDNVVEELNKIDWLNSSNVKSTEKLPDNLIVEL